MWCLVAHRSPNWAAEPEDRECPVACRPDHRNQVAASVRAHRHSQVALDNPFAVASAVEKARFEAVLLSPQACSQSQLFQLSQLAFQPLWRLPFLQPPLLPLPATGVLNCPESSSRERLQHRQTSKERRT